MDFDDTQVTDLHYLMLDYLYDKQKLSSSCFNHCWEDFKSQNLNVAVTAGQFCFVDESGNPFLTFHNFL
jgi:hypothetical protein